MSEENIEFMKSKTVKKGLTYDTPKNTLLNTFDFIAIC